MCAEAPASKSAKIRGSQRESAFHGAQWKTGGPHFPTLPDDRVVMAVVLLRCMAVLFGEIDALVDFIDWDFDVDFGEQKDVTGGEG